MERSESLVEEYKLDSPSRINKSVRCRNGFSLVRLEISPCGFLSLLLVVAAAAVENDVFQHALRLRRV